ncbi:hypothetical protein V1503_02915 [Bacillus sp. SCS-151]|uniref:hypothetical protein n=1 Tax=Nanhaiella sioensis TaxID=3115293 RepID=UPI00397BF9F1
MMNGGHMGSFGGNGGFYGYNGMPSGFNNFDMMFNGSFMTIIVIGIITVGLILIFKNQKIHRTSASSYNKQGTTVIEAEEVAKLRYARGEITHDELQAILKTIKM